MLTDEDVVKASRTSLDPIQAQGTAGNSSRPTSVHVDELVPVKEEKDDGPTAGLVADEEDAEEEYEGDYEDDEEGEEYGEEEEDDEFLDDIEQGLEEPFL